MKFSSKHPLFALLFVLAIFLAAPVAAFAQGGESGGLHYFGAAAGSVLGSIRFIHCSKADQLFGPSFFSKYR